ncbi:MAG: glycosyltransferase [Pseudomonadota bacterium]
MNILAKLALNLRGSLNKPSDRDFIADIKMGEQIPKIIHQTYYTKNLPIELERNLLKNKEANPGWELRFYDDEDIEIYIKTHFPELFDFYEKINPNYGAAKADFFRYLVVYNDGGVYLDIKSGAEKPLDSIIIASDKYILSHWPRSYPKAMLGQHRDITNPIGEFQQWHIISVAGHPFLKAVINSVCNNILHYNPILHEFGAFGVFNSTGPIAYTEAIYPLLNKYPHRLEKDHLDVGLIYSALDDNHSLSTHLRVYTKKHYLQLEEPVITQSKFVTVLFYTLKPLIKYLKIKLKASL